MKENYSSTDYDHSGTITSMKTMVCIQHGLRQVYPRLNREDGWEAIVFRVLTRMGHGGLFVALAFVGACMGISAQTSSQREIQLHYQRALVALSANHDEEASREFREILKIDPRNAEAYANLGQIAYRRRVYAEAATSLDEALKLKPQLWDAKALLGLSDMMLGRTNEGDQLLIEAFPRVSNPSLKMDVGVALVRFHMATHTLNRVVGVVHALEESNPDNQEVLYIAYRAYSGLAADALGALYRQWPDSARVHQIFAQADVTQDDFPNAIKQYKQAIEADPKLPGIHYELGRTILTNSQDNTALQEAEKEFEAELSANPWDADSEYELGEVFRLGRNWLSAEKHYVLALQINPNLGAAQTALGDVLVSMGKLNEALPHLESGVRLNPDDETAHYRLSRAYEADGRHEDAKREMNIFLKLRHEHASSNAQPSQPASDIPVR
jgi:tetratricopeptide (TPR) repeat protein